MAYNLSDETLINQIVNDLAALKQQMYEIRTNQTNTLKYGNITLNGNTNQITVGSNLVLDQSGYMVLKDNSANEIVRFDASGITVKTVSSGAYNRYMFFQKSGANVGQVAFIRYTPASQEVSDMVFRVQHGSSGDRVTYNTMDIYSYDGLTRDVFFQLDANYSGGVFQSSSITFGKHGVSGGFSVTLDDTSGNGYMKMPSRSSDPTAVNGRMYYNTSTNKVRVCENLTWRDA